MPNAILFSFLSWDYLFNFRKSLFRRWDDGILQKSKKGAIHCRNWACKIILPTTQGTKFSVRGNQYGSTTMIVSQTALEPVFRIRDILVRFVGF
jgi:hypothetical protein